MKWQRVTIVSRLVCLLLGAGGALPIWLIVPARDEISQPLPWFYLFMGAMGAAIFLFVGIVGLFPDIAAMIRSDKP